MQRSVRAAVSAVVVVVVVLVSGWFWFADGDRAPAPQSDEVVIEPAARAEPAEKQPSSTPVAPGVRTTSRESGRASFGLEIDPAEAIEAAHSAAEDDAR